MTAALRRLILKPPAAPASQITRLADALSEAVDIQNRLAAKSPYVLRFAGSLQQDATAFWVEHEPATALAARDLFDEKAPLASEDQLLRTAAAVLDALAAAHTSSGGRAVIHGGLCPGVILIGADGLIKVTDFGFAPAVCKTMGVDSYLNLAIGPQLDTSGGWEVLGEGVMDRDDRLCAFIDPDKYGQDTLSSFEPGSDIIAAGMLLHLLADHRHPYLYFERQAHRVVDMARMMSFGVPSSIRRKDLSESTSPAAQAFCQLVAAMLARLPGERPPAPELIKRLVAAAPAVDVDVLKAQRWLEQLEALLAAKEWRELETALKDAPQLQAWPADLRTRVDNIERQYKEYVTEEGRRAAVEAEFQTARAWFDRLKTAVGADDWEAATELLSAKPQIEHWPDEVQQDLSTLVARIDHARAVKKALAWRQALQKAIQVKDWAAVGRRFAQRPAPEHCPPEVLEYAATIEAQYQEYLAEQERQRQEIERQHAEVRAWLDRAKSLTQSQEWVAAIDHLAVPPEVEHWPEGSREEADELTSLSRNHLGDAVASNLDAITENIRRQAEAAVRGVLTQRLAGLLHPDRVETTVDFVMWAPPDTDADGRAPVLVRLRPPTGSAAGEPAQAELDFHLRGDDARICHGLDELRKRAGDTLSEQVLQLQTAQLYALEVTLRASIYPNATIRAQLTSPQPRTPAEAHLLGVDVAEGVVPVELRWSDAALAWAPTTWSVLVGQALELARTVSQRVVHTDFLARSAVLKAYESLLGVSLAAPAGAPAGALPKSLSFETRVGVHTADRTELRLVYTGATVCNRVGQAACDANLPEVETKLNKLIMAAQEASRQTLNATLKQRVKAAAARATVNAPKRSRTPVDEIPFELKPKSGSPVILSARWNARSLVYELPAEWEKTIAPLLAAPPPPPPRVKLPRAPRVGPSRRGLVLGATGVVLVLAIGGVYFATRGGKPAPVPPPTVTPPPTEAPVSPPTGRPQPDEVTPPPPEQVTPPLHETVTRPPEEKTQPVEEPAHSPEQTVPPAQEVVAPPEPNAALPEEVAPPPTPKDPVQSLRDYWQPRLDLSDSKGLSVNKLFNELIPVISLEPGGQARNQLQFLTAVQEQVTVFNLKHTSEGRVSIDVSVALKRDSGTATDTFTMLAAADQWQPDSDNSASLSRLVDAAKQALLQSISNTRRQIETDLTKSDLVNAHARFSQANVLLEPLAEATEVVELRDLMASVPPAWVETLPGLTAAGYTADGEPDASTGYPSRLKDRQGNVLVGIAVPPGDTLWGDLKGLGSQIKSGDPLYDVVNQAEAARSWRVLYIDSAASATDDFAQARTVAKDRARGLPTRDEWFLMALKLRADTKDVPDLFGGLWQWCDDPAGPQDGKHWLCGGSRLLTERKSGALAAPQPADDLKAWWTWLTNPLVMQRRPASFGDQLTGVRTVLRIYPRG